MKSLSLILAALLIGAGTIVADNIPAAVVTSGFATSPQAPATAKAHSNSPNTARLYSIFLPGGGQFYNGETGKGLAFLGAAVLGYTLFATNIPSTDFHYDPDYYYASYGYWYDEGNAALCYGGLALALGATVWSAIDAPKGALRHNQRLGVASLPIGEKVLWANIDPTVSRGCPGYSLKIGLSF